MRFTRSRKIILLLSALAPILACSYFAPATPQPAATLDALYTSAAQTLEAMSTQAVVTLPAGPSPTSTLSIPTASPIVVNTFTAVPPIQPVTRCDAASFVNDVTYPDGSVVSRGGTFTKVWRIKNVGTCTWTSSYAIVFVSGDQLGAPNAVSLPGSVAPGQTVDLSVNLTAPNTDGRYRGYWRLRNPSGVLFGVGAAGDSNFYVDVSVTGFNVTGYDFAANFCEARWRNDSRNLPCPGTEGDNKGFVLFLDSPKMEDNNRRGPGLLTYPSKSNTGVIKGQYPAINVKSGDRFQALIGCLYKANDCNVIFRLEYQIGNGSIGSLGQWQEVYEGQYYPLNIDLNALSGENVKFILTVFTNGTSHEDFALWVNPRITRISAQPPTATFTVTSTLPPTATATSTSTATPTATPSATPTSTP
ncbi:MAG TPA: NBR1-Ig-like domain-containing protein [Anaerolineales bacterium]|nr:NBR1-Ig-like domain-containing protein [Anaerolineales bacterium]